MELLVPIILLISILVIFLFTRKDKGKILESFSVGDFLIKTIWNKKIQLLSPKSMTFSILVV
ncbi:hypothetical protein [Oceanobacillus bengalensis]|uniref:Uncharacterized protein n=1 Tax=Oceanobacillus bengalensis TaxID=1435466 RepID=A0A494YUX4_9BACI|nr:hypothetical protein [Oceanobacillus bengalensis]RKQ13898.1 hypothetical protein D8M05_14510 [Oceanobacillus bengalensis]